MFNIGPMEAVVLALVGIVVLGPDRLPQFARDAARMLRTLRDLATGAREQLRDELGPEFADVDLRNLNPRTAVQRAVFGDDVPDLRKFSPGNVVRDAWYGADEDEAVDDSNLAADEPVKPVSTSKRPAPPAPSAVPQDSPAPSVNGRPSANGAARPRPRPRPRTSYDDDAT